jgi:tetraacyldisaccharide-1-P 4'-kinase
LNGAEERDAENPVAGDVVRYASKATMYYCIQTIEYLLPFDAWNGADSGAQIRYPRSAYLVAGLGNPGRFERDVRRLGIDVAGTRFFADHHWLAPEDWQDCVRDARGRGAEAIITTEKDAIKISWPPQFCFSRDSVISDIHAPNLKEAGVLCARAPQELGNTGRD